MYPVVKCLHMMFVFITLILFNLRFFLRTVRPEKTLPKILGIVPHINDSLLLFSGMLMLHIMPWQPFGANKWLGMKFVLVLVYIIFGAMCLKSVPRSVKWYGFYGLTLCSMGMVVYLAHFKPLI
ncbi:MAG: SirB2 family protein [Alysiella sp.]|uniref:SirB2 family protein n=1 Tax=Alysiella sp. TaxID=1872483 RepID=UPI0026DB20B7|nr:SirB2 family protein [Alysiella sp.]MDO4433362.1 SirB2 family protein [Alysiella sp.]